MKSRREIIAENVKNIILQMDELTLPNLLNLCKCLNASPNDILKPQKEERENQNMSAYNRFISNLEYEIKVNEEYLKEAQEEKAEAEKAMDEHDNYCYEEAWEKAKARIKWVEAYLAGLNEALEIAESMESDFANDCYY